jgi:hypothetical protein
MDSRGISPSSGQIVPAFSAARLHQLPEGKDDALAILDAARRLGMLPGFWDGEPEKKPATVVRIGGNECA